MTSPTPPPSPPEAMAPFPVGGPRPDVEFVHAELPPPPLPPTYAGPPEPEPRGPRRYRFLPRSLTSKLVAGVVALVFVLVCLTGIGTYLALKSELQSRLDQQLQTTAGNSPQTLQNLFSASATTTVPGVQAPQYLWAVALADDGSIIAYPPSPAVKKLLLTVRQRQSMATRSTASPLTVRTTDGDQLRVTARSISVATGFRQAENATVLIGLSTDEEQRTIRQLVRLEIYIGGGALLVALFATSYGVSFSLRRLRQVSDTAQEVAAELSPDGAGLDRRVPVVEEGTEVGQLAESMNTLLAAVETQFAARVESEKRMRQFLADASHELRTPLTSIRGYAELARMQRASGNPDEDNLGRIESEGTRMSRLVEDLLMLARGDHDTIPRTELVDVSELLDDAVAGSRAAFPQRAIELEPVASYHVVGDPDQLVRAVRNLIGNAAVHTNPAAPIRIRAFVDGPGIAIQVVDAGPGLPPEEAAHVFERFWRADKARTRVRGGSGLGLAIVASIAEAHGGAAHFESTVAGGSTVTVWLPGVTT